MAAKEAGKCSLKLDGLCPAKTMDPVGRGMALVLKERRKGYQGVVGSQDHTSPNPTSSYVKSTPFLNLLLVTIVQLQEFHFL